LRGGGLRSVAKFFRCCKEDPSKSRKNSPKNTKKVHPEVPMKEDITNQDQLANRQVVLSDPELDALLVSRLKSNRQDLDEKQSID
jgi:hypothetical protein